MILYPFKSIVIVFRTSIRDTHTGSARVRTRGAIADFDGTTETPDFTRFVSTGLRDLVPTLIGHEGETFCHPYRLRELVRQLG